MIAASADPELQALGANYLQMLESFRTNLRPALGAAPAPAPGSA